MFRNVRPCPGALVLAGAALVLTAGPGRAAGPFGTGPAVGHYAGANLSYYRGYNPSAYHPYAAPQTGYSFQPHLGTQSFSGFHPEYGYRPPGLRHYAYGNYPFYDPSTGWAYDPGYYGYGSGGMITPPGEPAATPRPRRPGGAALLSESPAHITVLLPKDAELWFDGTKTSVGGPIREFNSPLLQPDRRYGYDVRARWQEGGRTVTQTRHVRVSAGAYVLVDFPAPPAAEDGGGGRQRP